MEATFIQALTKKVILNDTGFNNLPNKHVINNIAFNLELQFLLNVSK